jgi:membrane fusion protein (multidrug efflux system)
MTKNRAWIGLIVLVALAAIIFLVLVVFKPKPAEEEGFETNMAVHTGRVVRMTLRRSVTAYGQVAPQPAGPGQAPADSEVASPLAGVVARVLVIEGQRVAKGTVLFELDDRVAKVAVEKAQKALAVAQAAFDRQEELLPVEGTSRKAYDEAKGLRDAARGDLAAAETDLALLRIQAPLDGTVVLINSEPGEAVETNTVLARIIDLGRLVVQAAVPSREAGSLRAGQKAEFEGSAAPGRVIYVGSAIDDKSDTIPVRVSLPPGTAYRPGEFLSVRVVSEEHSDVLAVPERAVMANTVGGTEGTIVLVKGEEAVHLPVTIGLREGGWVEVRGEGLKEGTEIITDDAYAVPAEPTKIHVIK